MYSEEDFIQLSSIQHYAFCKRQFYLAYVEEVWIENFLTASGRLLHQHVDDVHKEKRKGLVQEFGIAICSYALGISGKADVVEFHHDGNGILEQIIPIEYKRGAEKGKNFDEMQLCAQATCLEEMTGKSIDYGYLFYGKERRRSKLLFSLELREETASTFLDIHALYQPNLNTPKAVYSQKCKSCSFFEYCKPKTIGKKKSAERYFNKMICEAVTT
jgi:CRISPR-associated exonuclease Cas4